MFGNVYILGGNGRIGNALNKHALKQSLEAFVIERAEYNNWDNQDHAIGYFKKQGLTENDLIICASGIIDPKVEHDEIHHSNVNVPANACQAAVTLGAKAISLGTVMEDIIPAENQNTYVSSKTELANLARDKWLHLQLHTVYGGPAPAPFMFTGLMLSALKNGKRFSMTSGEQLREYHHVEDEAAAIFELASTQSFGRFDVSSGESVKLCDLASSVFKHFNRDDLLGIGDMKSPDVEAYEPSYKRQSALKDSQFRPAIPALAQWLEKHV